MSVNTPWLCLFEVPYSRRPATSPSPSSVSMVAFFRVAREFGALTKRGRAGSLWRQSVAVSCNHHAQGLECEAPSSRLRIPPTLRCKRLTASGGPLFATSSSGRSGFGSRTSAFRLASALALAATGSALLFVGASDPRSRSPVACDSPDCYKNHDNPLWRSREGQPFARKLGDALLFTGTSNEHLGAAVAERLSTRLGRVSVGRFADGEVSIQFLDSLRGKDVYIIQPTSSPVNDHLMELLLMISTCRRASAKKITAVIPYFGYARQDRKMNSRVPISAVSPVSNHITVG